MQAPAIDQLTTAVLLFDEALHLRAMNVAAETLLSLSRRQALGQPVRALGAGLAPLAAALRRAGESAGPVTERDLQLRAAERTMVVDCTVSPLDDRAATGVLVELTNVDRLHRIYRDERLQAQGAVANALVRGLAHEIRNPLGGIRGAAQLLERALPGGELHEHVRIIIAEVDRLRALIDRMLEPQGGAVATRVNVHEVLERVRGLVEAEFGAGCAVQLDYDPSLPELHAVGDQLVQVFLNVLRNAFQAAGAHGRVGIRTRVQRQVTIGTRLHRLVLRVDISDDGPGVPEAIAATVFYPMVCGRAEGTGLGLAIAQSLVQRHGGLIEFDSRPGATTFSVLLPVEHERAQA